MSERIKQLSDQASEQQSEESLLNFITSLDNASMVKFLYKAQFSINKKLYDNMITSGDKSEGDDTVFKGLSEGSQFGMPQAFPMNPMMGLNPLLAPPSSSVPLSTTIPTSRSTKSKGKDEPED